MLIPLNELLQAAEVHFSPNEQQIDALEYITNFFEQRGTTETFVLKGYAGTGKTSIVKILLTYAKLRGFYGEVAVTAPTHRAKSVIAKIAGKPGTTIHKILGMRPEADIEKMDLRELLFQAKLSPTLPLRGILIVDEASMIQDHLADFIEDKCEEFGTRILYIGDPAQLKPVKQETVSKIFNNPNSVELTMVMRQQDGNPLGLILDSIRNNKDFDNCPFTKMTNLNSAGQGIYCTDSALEFFKYLTKDYKKLFTQDTASVKMLAYTNDKVAVYNTIVRKALGYKEPMPVTGDVLMAYDNITSVPDRYNPQRRYCEIFNSSDYEILESHNTTFKKHGLAMKGQEFVLKALGSVNELNQTIFVLDKETNENLLMDIGDMIESLREDGMRNGGKAWLPYFEFKSSFASYTDIVSDGRVVKNKTFDYGYATTIHKSQGGTYHTVFVDDRDIDICPDAELKNQLKYVALSRPTDKAVLFS